MPAMPGLLGARNGRAGSPTGLCIGPPRAMTQARKHVFAREFEATLADNIGKPFAELSDYLRGPWRATASLPPTGR